MNHKTIIKLLEGVKLFQGLGPGDLTDLLGQCSGATFVEGEIIFSEGDLGRYAYVVISGKVEVFRRATRVKRQLVRLGPGECFGEMSLVLSGDAGRTAGVRAVERTSVLKIERETLSRLPAVASKVYLNIARTLAQRLKTATDTVVLLAQQGADFDPGKTLGGPQARSEA